MKIYHQRGINNMISEENLARLIADILYHAPNKCLSLQEIYIKVQNNPNCEIPADGYDPIPYGPEYYKLKGTKWKEFPEEQLKSIVSTEPKWKNEVRMSKRRLNDWGWLEKNCKRGVWCLSAKGQEEISNY